MTAAPTEGVPHPIDLAARSRRSPTVLRILLGTQLRRLRESRHIRLEEAGHAIRASHSKISRMELGRVGFRRRDVADLLTLYGVTDESEREALLSLVAQANAPGWWHKYDDVLPSWFEAYVGLEQAASAIRCYEVQFVPGLLQAPAYAEAVVRLGHPDASGEEIERRVRLRMDRQEVLVRPDPPILWAVIDEAVLRRPVGGAEVMRAQIEHLLEMVAQPRVTLQIIPFSAGGTRPPEGRSASCASRGSGCRTSSTSNSSPAPSTWRNGRTSTAISPSWNACACRPDRCRRPSGCYGRS
ncbi:hypothetical protein GCM10027612_08650 [Microbispora bryophytorum subsp. camponoti]